MNIFPLIYCPILLYAFSSYHKAVLLYAVMRLVLSPAIPFFNMPGDILILLGFFMDSCMIMLLCLGYIGNIGSKSQHIDSTQTPFPLKNAFFIFMLSISISTLMSPLTNLFSAIRTIYVTIVPFIFIYLLWRELKTLKDIQFVIKGFMIVFSVAIIYGFIENFNDFTNPFVEYKLSLLTSKQTGAWMVVGGEDVGRKRIVSIFDNPLDCGGYAAIAFAFFFYLNMQYKKIWNTPKLARISLLSGLVLLLLFANGRGAMLYFAISLLFMLNLKTILRLFLFLPFFIVLSYSFIAQSIDTIKSIANPDNSETIKGSSWTMRVMQLSIVIDLLKSSPLIGYGEKAVSYFQSENSNVYGLESIWLQLLAKQGFFGVVSYIYMLRSFFKLGLGKSKRYVIGSIVAYIALVTTSVGGDLYFQLTLLLIAYRLELLLGSEMEVAL